MITVHLTIPVIDVSVNQSEDTLTAVTDALYQWLDCNNDFGLIQGAVDRKFTPAVSGDYAVKISKDGCVDTSACFAVVITGMFYNTLGDGLNIYPNPANSVLTIDLPQAYEKTDIEVRNLSGQMVIKEMHSRRQKIELTLSLPAGLYLLSVKNNLGQGAILKLMVE
jgi:hypothetical protein